MTKLFARRFRGAIMSTSLFLAAGCSATDPTMAPQRTMDVAPAPGELDRTVALVGNAGCTLGLGEGDDAARVSLIPRGKLPFALPGVNATASQRRALRLRIVRMAVPAGGARPSAMLACLLPADGDYVRRAIANVRQSSDGQWATLARAVETTGALVHQNVYRAVARELLDSTLLLRQAPSTSTGAFLRAPGGTANWGSSGPNPQPLPTVTVTASGTAVVFDTHVLRGIFGMGESVSISWEMEIARQQWSQDCDEWNRAMDEYDATKDAVAAAAEDEAAELESLADVLEGALGPLETATASCKPTNGKKMCIDFFIMNCWFVIGFGDCRDFDRNADYGNSRVQLYLDPATRAWEVKYSCTTVVTPATTPQFSTVCDSARVFDPAEDVQTFSPDANGWTRVQMSFRNNVCVWHDNPACPAIDATVRLRPNASAPGGFDIMWERDGFPSMGVYVRNSANTDWLVAVEDPQKTRSGLTAIRALAGQIRAKGYNYPPPGNQPEGCYRQ